MSEHVPASVSGYRQLSRVHRNARARTEVWHASSSEGEEVALKLVARETDAEEQEYRHQRFRAEVEAGQALRHEHIRPLLGFGSDPAPCEGFPNGVDFLAFPWIDGPTLAEVLTRRKEGGEGPLRARDWRDLGRALANALAAMHRATPRWVHRDVKPANVLLPMGDFRSAVLADLGIAWREGSPRHSHVVGLSDSGTLPYMAPEQLSGEPDISPAADQYALALVLWECATGEVPHTRFPARSDIARARREGQPLPEFRLEARSATAVEQVLVRALHPNPRERWADVGEFWLALHAAGVAEGWWDPDVSVSSQSHSGRGPHPPTPGAHEQYDVPEVWMEQQAHDRLFVGRDEVLKRCQQWLRSDAHSSYLVVVGPPGQGKSATMSRLAVLEGADGGTFSRHDESPCLLHMVKSAREPRRILQFLLWQAEKHLGTAGAEDRYRADLESLRGSVADALGRLAATRHRVTLVLDALDELPAEAHDFAFLPPRLPPGVRAVLSCRPDADLLSRLRARLTEFDTVVLPSLPETDARQLAEEAFGIPASELERVLDLSGLLAMTSGSPLILRHAAHTLHSAVTRAATAAHSARVDLTNVPTSLDAVFREVYASIAGRRGAAGTSDDALIRVAIAQVLACAPGPLKAAQLRGVLSAGGRSISLGDLQAHLDGMSQYLQASQGALGLFHKGLADYIARNVMGEDEVADVHGWYLAWLRGPQGRKDPYFPAHVSDHHRARFEALLVFGEPATIQLAGSEWLGDLLSIPYLQAQVARGAVYDVQTDLQSALETVGPDTSVKSFHALPNPAEAAVMFTLAYERAHVLAQWPALLPQELRNVAASRGVNVDYGGVPATRPALLLQSRIGEPRTRSYLKRMTISFAPLEGMVLIGDSGVVTLDQERQLGVWNIHTGGGETSVLPQGTLSMLAGDPNGGGLVVWASGGVDGGHFTGSYNGKTWSIAWPAGAGMPDKLEAATDEFVAVFGPVGANNEDGDSVYRFDVRTGTGRRVAQLPGRAERVAIAPDAEWLWVSMRTEAPAEDVLDGTLLLTWNTQDEEVARVQLDEPTWSLMIPPAGPAITVHEGSIRFWSGRDLHELGSLIRESGTHMAFHPSRPRALLFDRFSDRVRVLDLQERRILRSECWSEVPVCEAFVTRNGKVLVGDLSTDPYWAEQPIGVWELPDHFWDAPSDASTQESSREDEASGLTWPVVATVSDGAVVLRRPVPGCLAEYEADDELPRRVLTGGMLGHTTIVEPFTGALSLLVGSRRLDILSHDLGEQPVVRTLVLRDHLHSLHKAQDAYCAIWFPGDPQGASTGDEADRQRTDTAIAGFVLNGVPVIELEDAQPVITVESLPWTTPWESGAIGISRMDLETGSTESFIELPPIGNHWNRTDVMEGGRYVVHQVDDEEVVIVQVSSGEVLYEFKYGHVPLCAYDDHRLFCVTDTAGSYLLDVRTGVLEELGIDFDAAHLDHMRFDFALSRDRTLVVWNRPEGISVNELWSGNEVAFYPAHGWTGRFSWLDDRTISAQGWDGVELKLLLDGYHGSSE